MWKASGILDRYDATGREGVPSRKRAEAKSPDHFRNRSCAASSFRHLVEPLLAGNARRGKILFGPAETGLRNRLRHLLSRSGMEAASAESRAISVQRILAGLGSRRPMGRRQELQDLRLEQLPRGRKRRGC